MMSSLDDHHTQTDKTVESLPMDQSNGNGLEDIDDGSVITLVSYEGYEIRSVSKHALIHSSDLLKTMIEGDPSADSIPLPQVKFDVLKRIVGFITYHHKNPMVPIDKPLVSKEITQVIKDSWDVECVNIPNSPDLIGLLTAANYMNIESLINLCAVKVALQIKGKSVEEVRRVMEIPSTCEDLSTREIQQINKEHEWINTQ
jgi:S-phase kinase-associated protein 1